MTGALGGTRASFDVLEGVGALINFLGCSLTRT
jgi:hypothetical protein